tara:strand:- start:639 stop:3134 length:2496 start_codon:yes stop_codon:yes gene_type:complete
MSSNKTGFRQGRLGIGKEPIFPLDISGSMRIEGDLVLAGTIADAQGNPIEFGATSATFNMDKTFPDPTIAITEFPDWSGNVVVEGAGKFEDIASKNGDIFYNGGNVGIGTTNPQSRLDIHKTLVETGLNETDGIRFTTSQHSWNWSLGYIGGYNLANNGTASGFPGGIIFKTKEANSVDDHNLTTRMVIDAAGNVGIGTTDPGTYKLYVNGNTYINGTTTATTFSGALSGNATTSTTATNANKVKITGTNTYASNLYPMLQTAISGTNDCWTQSNGTFYYRANTNRLYCTHFQGALTGNATTSTTANNINLNSLNSSSATQYVTFAGAQTGANQIRTDEDFKYYPNTGKLIAPIFQGAFTGNVTGNCSGNAGSANTASQVFVTHGTTTNSSHRINFTNSTGNGNAYIYGDADFVFNPNLGFVGIGATASSEKLRIDNGSIMLNGDATNHEKNKYGIIQIWGTGSGRVPARGIAWVSSVSVQSQYTGTTGLTSDGAATMGGWSTQFRRAGIFSDGGGYGSHSGNLIFEVKPSAGRYEWSNSLEAMRIESNGRVGIGEDSPWTGLHVETSHGGNYHEAYNSFLWESGHTYTVWTSDNHRPSWSDSNSYFSIYSNRAILIRNGGIWSASDKRIKINIEDVPDNLALEMVRNIPCRYYEYKDPTRQNGNKKTIGFIAQEVDEIFPLAVTKKEDLIPSEMRLLVENENAIWTDLSDNTYKLYINDLEDTIPNTKCLFVLSDSSDNIIEKQVRLLDDGKSFIFDKKWNKVFLHSKTVNDFHVVDKQKLFALNFSATQELDRQQQADKAEIAELKTKVSTLESALETVLTRLTELENK